MGQGQEQIRAREVEIPPLGVAGTLSVPANAYGLAVFVHGSGSSRLSPRNRPVSAALNRQGLATLLFDLLKADEESDRRKVFDIPLLSGRLGDAVRWTGAEPDIAHLPLGLFGASTGAAAALVLAAEPGSRIGAVVSRGGRPDLAGAALTMVRAPTLLIVGGHDFSVIALNEAAFALLAGPKSLQVVPGATHLFPEAGALEAVTRLAAGWFAQHLPVAERK